MLIDLVKKRYSVRSYDPKPLRREDIDECLEAARLAPSACNSQPWQFIVADKPDLKGRLCDAMLSGIYGMNGFIREAPALIVVVTDKTKWFVKVCNVLRDTKMYLVDLGIACEHLVLRAAELGIGTCYLGWFNEAATKRILNIPKSKRVDLVISMGYPASGFDDREKNRKALTEISSYAA